MANPVCPRCGGHVQLVEIHRRELYIWEPYPSANKGESILGGETYRDGAGHLWPTICQACNAQWQNARRFEKEWRAGGSPRK